MKPALKTAYTALKRTFCGCQNGYKPPHTPARTSSKTADNTPATTPTDNRKRNPTTPLSRNISPREIRSRNARAPYRTFRKQATHTHAGTFVFMFFIDAKSTLKYPPDLTVDDQHPALRANTRQPYKKKRLIHDHQTGDGK